MSKMIIGSTFTLCCLGLILLGGCAQSGGAALASTIAVIINEDKLPSDFIGDAVSGEDCNSIRRMEDGGPLCRKLITPEFIDRPVYCYRTLGAVECFDKRDPYGTGAQMIE